jgi:hypothetical protein
MLPKLLAGLSLFLSFFLLGVQTQPPDIPVLTSPQSGSAIQGSVHISGTIPPAGFQYAEVSFRYTGGQAGNWFLIQQVRQPVKNGLLAVWDTTTIADGSYAVRLQVFLEGGKVEEVLQSGLRVRNYTAIETNTPTAVLAVTATPVPRPAETATPLPLTATPRSTPTQLSPNPAQIQPGQLYGSLAIGLGTVLVLFLVIAFYQSARK